MVFKIVICISHMTNVFEIRVERKGARYLRSQMHEQLTAVSR